MNRPGDHGREAENLTVKYLSENGWPYAERRRLTGARDKGDLTGSPGLMWEVKYLGKGKSPRLSAWMKQVDVQSVHANADFGILVVKPFGFGEKTAGKFWAAMRQGAYRELFNRACGAGWDKPVVLYTHSNARLSSLGEKLVELDRIPGCDWAVDIATRVAGADSLTVMTLERIVPLLHAAGYGDSRGV